MVSGINGSSILHKPLGRVEVRLRTSLIYGARPAEPYPFRNGSTFQMRRQPPGKSRHMCAIGFSWLHHVARTGHCVGLCKWRIRPTLHLAANPNTVSYFRCISRNSHRHIQYEVRFFGTRQRCRSRSKKAEKTNFHQISDYHIFPNLIISFFAFLWPEHLITVQQPVSISCWLNLLRNSDRCLTIDLTPHRSSRIQNQRRFSCARLSCVTATKAPVTKATNRMGSSQILL